MGPINYLVDHMMIPFLEFSYLHFFANYGIAIILLTVLIKLIFFPLMNKQYQSMKMMQKLAPKMKEIREKYKKQPDKMQKETLKLYQENKVNPMSGCLPMIVQIPFFLAIYSTILSENFQSLIKQPGVNPGLFPFWLSDLSLPDNTFVLPLALAGFTYWSQKLIMTDPNQKKFLLLSPLLILGFGFKLPSGVLLYWATSTILSTLQQFWVMRAGQGSSQPLQLKQAK